jgi:hypothetical protein
MQKDGTVCEWVEDGLVQWGLARVASPQESMNAEGGGLLL